ncbi:acyl-CoA carboxylase epsilon subunit [Janibacter cremeus]|uniref:Acyl-CoA carboxylase epsilon subunit n=1 Tax=Janibacter cremeus TaxID=1285192 RepID=A0A852VWR0_9MICO|nr:hypothetical protein [Janibacter cremeus]
MTSTTPTHEQPDTETPAAPTGPRIEVIGDASTEQVAALVAVLSGIGGDGDEEAPGPASRWASRERLVRAPLHPAPGAWRAAAFPG